MPLVGKAQVEAQLVQMGVGGLQLLKPRIALPHVRIKECYLEIEGRTGEPMRQHEKRELWAWKRAIIDRLAGLRLTSHESEAQVTPTRAGIPWLGWVVYPDYRHVKRRNVVNFRRRLRQRLDDYEAGHISFAELDASVDGWINHLRYSDTWQLRRQIRDDHPQLSPREADE